MTAARPATRGTRPLTTVRRVPVDPAVAPPGVSDVEVRRSARRTRSVSAHREGSRVVVLVPARLSAAEEDRWVARMLARLARPTRASSTGDDDLAARARVLSARHLDGRARPVSVRWSSRQQQRWGSCTPTDGTIRISERLRVMPGWVLDYVLVHELTHLLEPDHGPGFHALLDRYPHTARAGGFLDGVSFAAGEAPGDVDTSDGVDSPDNADSVDGSDGVDRTDTSDGADRTDTSDGAGRADGPDGVRDPGGRPGRSER